LKIFSRFLKSDGRKLVGIDVGSYSAKGVVLARQGKSFQLADFALERISAGGRTPGPDTSSVLGKIVSRLGVEGDDIATDISGQQVVMRHIEVPKMTEDELRASIKYETDIHFPFRLEDAVVDFHILEKAEGVDANKMKVFMVAARTEMVKSHIKMLGSAGITPESISVDAVALVNACESAIDTAGKCAALVNVGSRKTTLVIICDGIFSFAREAEIGCAKLSSAISKGLSVSNDEADRVVREKIGEHEAYFSSFLADVAREVKSSIDYFEERNTSKVDAVHIDGGGSMVGEFGRRLTEEIGLDVKRLDVISGATGGLEAGKKKGFEELSPLFTIAYGLARGMSG